MSASSGNSLSPTAGADRELLRAIFADGHPYRWTGIGDAASLRRIRRADLRAFHAAHFVAPGSLLVVTGPPRLDALARDAKSRFRGFAVDVAPPVPEVPPVETPTGSQRIPMPGRSQVEIRIGGPERHPVRPAVRARVPGQ